MTTEFIMTSDQKSTKTTSLKSSAFTTENSIRILEESSFFSDQNFDRRSLFFKKLSKLFDRVLWKDLIEYRNQRQKKKSRNIRETFSTGEQVYLKYKMTYF